MSLLVSSFRIGNRSIELYRSSLESEKDAYWIDISFRYGSCFTLVYHHKTLFYPKYHAYRIYGRMVGRLLVNDY